ncbi:MAG: hypothetical protein BGN88_15020 [Clostridiales bacterium 43-6]|nr:MAG: hypothetical protein BGN88_15020 [Clostridiales bacterium 43-6]
MTEKRLFKWDIIFYFLAIPLMFLQHFLYDITGKADLAAIIGAANESIWEHMKIIFLPFLLASVCIYFIVKPDLKRFLVATTGGLITVIVSMITLYYTYTGIIGHHILLVDILLSFIVLFLAFFVSYRLYTKWEKAERFFLMFAVLFLLLLAIYVLFTLFAPQLPLFLDTETMTYGIPKP